MFLGIARNIEWTQAFFHILWCHIVRNLLYLIKYKSPYFYKTLKQRKP